MGTLDAGAHVLVNKIWHTHMVANSGDDTERQNTDLEGDSGQTMKGVSDTIVSWL